MTVPNSVEDLALEAKSESTSAEIAYNVHSDDEHCVPLVTPAENSTGMARIRLCEGTNRLRVLIESQDASSTSRYLIDIKRTGKSDHHHTLKIRPPSWPILPVVLTHSLATLPLPRERGIRQVAGLGSRKREDRPGIHQRHQSLRADRVRERISLCSDAVSVREWEIERIVVLSRWMRASERAEAGNFSEGRARLVITVREDRPEQQAGELEKGVRISGDGGDGSAAAASSIATAAAATAAITQVLTTSRQSGARWSPEENHEARARVPAGISALL